MKVGFIGFGEAAYLISGGLISEGLKDITAFDVNASHPEYGTLIQERATELSIDLVPTLQTLVKNSELLICATSAKFAKAIAGEVSGSLKPNHIYVDINAASPMVKERIAGIMKQHNVKFVDAAVMDSVPNYRHKVPMLLSGDGIHKFKSFGDKHGMNLTEVGERAGRSSAIKMSRSVFMKGMTMLLFETLALANRYEAEDIIMESLNQTVTGKSLEDTANVLITRTVNHAGRRVVEMSEVQQTLTSMDLDSTMTEATRTKLSQLVTMRLNEYFDYQTPNHYSEVIAAMKKLT